MNEAMRAGPQVGQATDPLAFLRIDQFPGFGSVARANNELNLESRGISSFEFGCGRTHSWAVCGDADYVTDGPGCGLGFIYELDDYDRSQTFNVAITSVLATALAFSIDDPNGVGIGELLQDWFNGSTANTNTAAPLPDSVIEIRTYDCVFSIQQWQLSSFTEITPGQTYTFVIDTTVPYAGAAPCPSYDQRAADMAACIASLGIGTVSMSIHSQDPPQWGVLGSQDQAQMKCHLRLRPNVSFRPRTFYSIYECADHLGEIDFSAQVRDVARLAANAELSRLLEFDDGRNQNPSLISEAQNLTPGSSLGVPGTAVSVTRGMTLLMDALQANSKSGYGTFHGSNLALPWMQAQRQVMLDGVVYRGPMSFPYNPGPGFHNAIPVVAGGQPDGSTVDTDDNAWLYAIADAPVEYRVGTAPPFRTVDEWTPANAADYGRTNNSGAREEHKAIVRFNTCGTYAVRVCTADIENITVPVP